MRSPTVSPRSSTGTEKHPAHELSKDRAELVDASLGRNHAARGLVTGVLLGAGLWGAILVLFGVIKL